MPLRYHNKLVHALNCPEIFSTPADICFCGGRVLRQYECCNGCITTEWCRAYNLCLAESIPGNHTFGKLRSIYINGQVVFTDQMFLSYEGIINFVALRQKTVPLPLTVVYSIKFEDGTKKEGSLIAGKAIEVVEGMILNASHTGAA
jgi:hypothetical protein